MTRQQRCRYGGGRAGNEARYGLGGAFAVLLLCLFAFARNGFAQSTNAPELSNRWLFVVEISRAMQPRADTVREITAGLVASGANAQMHPGDTVGLWTFNDALFAGEFPLQQITTRESLEGIGRRTLEYLRGQQFSGGARLDRVMPSLNRLIRESPFLTIILITEGSQAVSGTPFDEQINARFDSWREQQSSSGFPFVTVLRASNAVLTDFAVNTPPFPLEMPPLPEELLKKVATPPVVQTQKPARPVAQPLIVSGRKPESAELSAAEPETNRIAAAQFPVTQPSAARLANGEPERTGEPARANVDAARTTVVEQTTAATEPGRDTPRPPTTSQQDLPNVTPPVRTAAIIAYARTNGGGETVKGSRTNPSTQALATATEPGSTRVIVAASIAVSLGVVSMLLFRWRSVRARHHQASLITRSLDRENR